MPHDPSTSCNHHTVAVRLLVPPGGGPCCAIVAAFPDVAGLDRDHVRLIALDPGGEAEWLDEDDDWCPWAWRFWLVATAPVIEVGDVRVNDGVVMTDSYRWVVVGAVAGMDTDVLVEHGLRHLHDPTWGDYRWRNLR